MTRARPPRFAPALGRAVALQLRAGTELERIAALELDGAASLRGLAELPALTRLSLTNPSSLAHLRGALALTQLTLWGRGRHRRHIDLAPLAALTQLRELSIYELRLGSLEALTQLPLRKLELRFCELPRQSLRLPDTLEHIDLDASAGLTLRGRCPQLRVIDLWGTGMQPLPWLAQQPAVDELWLCGCEVPSLAPLLELPRPPRWIFMDGHDEGTLARHQEHIAALERRGSRLYLGEDPHASGIWIPSWRQLGPREHEPLYLSPGWPREVPEGGTDAPARA